MAKPSDHPGFKDLLRQWNTILELDGFKDIEIEKHGELELPRCPSLRKFDNTHPLVAENRWRYYDLVAEYISETVFESEFEREILTLYAAGFSQAAIHRMLKIEGHRCKVYIPLYKWLRKWHLK